MKKFNYLLAAFGIFIFTACSGGSTNEEAVVEENVVEETVVEETVVEEDSTEQTTEGGDDLEGGDESNSHSH